MTVPVRPLSSRGDLPPIQRSADQPATERLVMCPPEYLSTDVTNNVFMSHEPIDVGKAMEQYARAKHVVEAFDVPVLEIPPQTGLQDQTYVANVAVAIAPYVFLANYKAPGRSGEVPVAAEFFQSLGYQVLQPPFDFEGEADLKHFKDDLYIGGVGQFSDVRAYQWIAERTGVRILPVEEVDEHLYHLDCSLFVLDDDTLLITGKGLSKSSLTALAKVADLVFTPKGIETTGITNGLKIPGKGIYLSGALNLQEPDYSKAMDWLLRTLDDFGYVPLFMQVTEADKSGADLSCMFLHLPFLPNAPAGPGRSDSALPPLGGPHAQPPRTLDRVPGGLGRSARPATPAVRPLPTPRHG